MNYTLHQLRIFLKISENQSITKTSEELHLSQPAVSIQLKNFQDQFSIPLTEHIGRRIFITDFGKEIAQTAETILNEVEAINYKTNAYNGILSGRLKFSIASTGKYVMPYYLSGFMKNHQAIDLNVNVTNKTQVVESLANNEVDFALVSVLPDKLKIDSISLLPNQLYFIGSRNFSTDLSTIKIWDNIPLIYREPGSATRKAMEDYIASKRIANHKKIELNSNEAVKQAVISGLGFSIMPLIGIKNELNTKDLEIVPTKSLPITTNWQLIWLKAKQHSPVAKSFLNFLKRHKDEVRKQYFGWIDDVV